jgi:hypothetical protein
MFNLLPKNENFFEDLDALAASVRSSAEHLNELIKRFPNIDKNLLPSSFSGRRHGSGCRRRWCAWTTPSSRLWTVKTFSI